MFFDDPCDGTIITNENGNEDELCEAGRDQCLTSLPTPAPGPSICDECNITFVSLGDSISMIMGMVQQASDDYANMYTASLNAIDCTSSLAMNAASSCVDEVDGQRQAINEFMKVVEQEMENLSQLQCAQNKSNTADPTCIFEDPIPMQNELLANRRRLNTFTKIYTVNGNPGGSDDKNDFLQPRKLTCNDSIRVFGGQSNNSSYPCIFFVQSKKMSRHGFTELLSLKVF